MYPCPDALHLVYLARASRPPELRSRDDWVLAPRFISPTEAAALKPRQTERVFLDAGLARLGIRPAAGFPNPDRTAASG